MSSSRGMLLLVYTGVKVLLNPRVLSYENVYHHWGFEFESRSGDVYSIQHYVIKFVSDLRLVGGFLREFRFPPTIKLTATKHHTPPLEDEIFNADIWDSKCMLNVYLEYTRMCQNKMNNCLDSTCVQWKIPRIPSVFTPDNLFLN